MPNQFSDPNLTPTSFNQIRRNEPSLLSPSGRIWNATSSGSFDSAIRHDAQQHGKAAVFFCFRDLGPRTKGQGPGTKNQGKAFFPRNVSKNYTFYKLLGPRTKDQGPRTKASLGPSPSHSFYDFEIQRPRTKNQGPLVIFGVWDLAMGILHLGFWPGSGIFIYIISIRKFT